MQANNFLPQTNSLEDVALFLTFLGDLYSDRIPLNDEQHAINYKLSLSSDRTTMTVDYSMGWENPLYQTTLTFKGTDLGLTNYVLNSVKQRFWQDQMFTLSNTPQ